MLKFVSNTGGGEPVDFETAILDGFAKDGGLYVPEKLPRVSYQQLIAWKDLTYVSFFVVKKNQNIVVDNVFLNLYC